MNYARIVPAAVVVSLQGTAALLVSDLIETDHGVLGGGTQ
jgi:hypothetical protein